jgi:RNA polymerase sigma factor (sigma-70 family)
LETNINYRQVAASQLQAECDEVIWNYFRNDCKEAFAVIYFRFFNILLQKGLQVSCDRELVKDCIHDLFLEIWINKLKLTTPQSVKAYLIVSLQRKIFHKIKKIRSQQTEMEKFPIEFVLSKEDQIISEQQMHDQKYIIEKAVNSLSKRQKEAIRLKFYSNLTYEEIAGTMNISTESIYNLVSIAITNLQKGLNKQPEPSLY